MESEENQYSQYWRGSSAYPNTTDTEPTDRSQFQFHAGSTQGTSFGDQQDNALQDYVHIICKDFTCVAIYIKR